MVSMIAGGIAPAITRSANAVTMVSRRSFTFLTSVALSAYALMPLLCLERPASWRTLAAS